MKLLNLLTTFWQEDPAVQEILNMIQPEINRLGELEKQVLESAAVETAATWALAEWERAFGIATDVSKSDTERREAIRTKMRSGSILTPEALMRFMASYYGGQVEIKEYVNDGVFTLTFVTQLGTPTNLAAVTAALDAVKPAQLAYELVYRYLLLHEVEAMTLGELETTTLDKFGGGTKYGTD